MTIYEAMARVSDSVRYIQERGDNREQNYKYVLGSDVKNTFHREFQRQGIICLPVTTSATLEPHATIYKGEHNQKGYMARVEVEFTLMLAENRDERYTSQFIGVGYDSTDKAINKAYTSAIKNFLISTFLVPSGDDPERDDDGNPLDVEAIEAAFDDMAKRLKACEPTKNAHKETMSEMLGHFKTLSKRPVEHPGEFASRTDAAAALAGLKQIEKTWRTKAIEAEADSGQAKERAGELFEKKATKK